MNSRISAWHQKRILNKYPSAEDRVFGTNPEGLQTEAGYLFPLQVKVIRSSLKIASKAQSQCWDKSFNPPEADKSSKYTYIPAVEHFVPP
jgi:hypothetical protein